MEGKIEMKLAEYVVFHILQSAKFILSRKRVESFQIHLWWSLLREIVWTCNQGKKFYLWKENIFFIRWAFNPKIIHGG